MPAPPLLSSKCVPPQLRSDALARPHLVEALAAPRAVVLVSAPPGYGKTTLVLGWLKSQATAGAWLTVDETDDDPAVFLAYLVTAIRHVHPGMDPAVDEAVLSPPCSRLSLTPLLNAIARRPDPLVLVIDDYHLIGNQHVHEILAFLAGHMPPNLRLVLLTRQDPPLPLARLRARAQLTEVRAADLRFTVDEGAAFLRGAMGLDIGSRAVEQLTERTEGWPAGLHLAGLSLRGRGDAEEFVREFGATDRYIFDYLTDEVLSRQPADIRAFLEATCILNRLSGPLCDALTGRRDGASTLAALEEANLFLAPLDDHRAWYRYHSLFGDILASSLPDERRLELHLSAAAWFAAHDLPLDAIRHYLAAGSTEVAATAIETVADLTLARGEFETVTSWCDALPPSVLAGHPALGVLQAWAQFFLGDIAGAEATLGRLPAEVLADDRVAGARRDCLEAWFANRHDLPEGEALARHAVEVVPSSDGVFRSLAFTTLGEALVGRDADGAAAAFGEAARVARVAGRSALAAGTVYSLAGADIVRGRRRDAEELCRRTILELRDRVGTASPWIGVVHQQLGVSLFEAGDFVQARQQMAIGGELCDRAGMHVLMLGATEWQEVICLHRLGDRQQAWRRLESVRREGRRYGISRLAVAMSLLAADLLLQEGDPEAALRRLDDLGDCYLVSLGATRDHGRAVHARVMLALGRAEEALSILDLLELDQRRGGRIGRLIGTLVATSLARDQAGDARGAVAALTDAVTLAAEQEYRVPFVDPAFPIRRLAEIRPEAPAFVDELLARPDMPLPASLPMAARPRNPAVLVEPLSVRELEVLRLVVAGLSNDEIGRALFVTTGTAKWHVHNLLGKVGARDRVGLVARARSLGLV